MLGSSCLAVKQGLSCMLTCRPPLAIQTAFVKVLRKVVWFSLLPVLSVCSLFLEILSHSVSLAVSDNSLSPSFHFNHLFHLVIPPPPLCFSSTSIFQTSIHFSSLAPSFHLTISSSLSNFCCFFSFLLTIPFCLLYICNNTTWCIGSRLTISVP